ncbi:hypothetical protein [Kaarinaea lacus]
MTVYMATHVTNQDLAGYIYQPSSKEFSFVGKHINACKKCRNSYTQMQTLLNQLKRSRESELEQVNEPHLTDEEILAYVHGQLNAHSRNKTQLHLDSCGSCMKSVLRYRAHLAEYESQQDINDDTTNVISLSARQNEDRKFARFALPFAAAASLIIAVLAVVQWQLHKPSQQVAGTQVVPPDMVVPGQNNAGSKTSHIIPASTGAYKTISWYGGFIETTAVGTADMSKMKNRVQAEIVAEKTARHLAYSQLAEILKGVQVTSNTTYEELLLKVDNLNVHSDGFIRGAQVIDKKISWVDDAPKATVTVRAPLVGQDSLKNIIQANTPGDFIATPQQALSSNTASTDKAQQYSNVIIDATGMEFSPALFTTLISASNQSIVDRDSALNLDYMYYAKLESAKASNYAGRSPVVVKAKASSTQGTLVLEDNDAQIANAILKRHQLNDNKPILVVF